MSTDFLSHFRTIRVTDKFSEFELSSNGLRVVLIPHASPTNTLSCTMNYHVGSYNEVVGFTGSAHYLEHLLFKDPLKGDKKNIFQLLDKHGSTINASTSYSRTNFYCVIPNRVFDVWAAAESERVRHIPFDIENRDKKESAVVVDELRMGNDNPFKKLTEAVMGAAFNRSGYNHMTSGYIKDVEHTTQKKLHSFWKNYYGPNNCSMVIVGNVNANKILKSIHYHFNDIEARPVKLEEREEVKQEGPRQVFVYSDKPYSMVQVAFRGMEGMHPDSIVLDLIGELMQYPEIGILNVLKENHVIPMFNVTNNRDLHRHLFQITAGLNDPRLIQTFQGALWKWFEGISTQRIDESTLQMAKKNITNKWNAMYENGVESLGAAATEAVALGNVSDIFDKFEHLNKITMEDIQRVAKYTFQDSRCTVGVLCPKPPGMLSRPLKDEHYEESLFQIETVNKDSLVGIQNLKTLGVIDGKDEMVRYKVDFGILQHLTLPSASKKMFIISTQAFDSNVSLGEIVCKIITDGIGKSTKVENAHALLFDNSNNGDSFNKFKVEKNLDFKIYSGKGRLNVIINFDKEHDSTECLQRVAEAIKNIPRLTKEDLTVKIQMCAGEWSGEMHDVNMSAHQKITETMFHENDTNFIVGAPEKIKMVNLITKDQLEGFLNNLFDKDRPFIVTAVSDEDPSLIRGAVETFHKAFSSVNAGYVPFESQPSEAKDVSTQTFELYENGREDGVVAVGIRTPVSRTHKDFSALRVASDILGDGIYSRLNLPLRVEKGLTYGTYSRLRGGHHGSDSYLHLFGSFKVSKLKEAKDLIHDILDKFVNEGVSEQEFKDKKSHLKNSIRVRMDSPQNMFMMHHQTLLNGKDMTYEKIMSNIKSVTHEDVNNAIKTYLKGQPRVTVVGGLPQE